jgi:hypothetical protein
VADGRRQHRAIPRLPAARRRNGRQGLHRAAPVGRSGHGRCRDRARRVRIPGTEVFRGEPHLRACRSHSGRAFAIAWSR